MARYIENQEITRENFASASLYEPLNPQAKTYETKTNSEDAIAKTIACIQKANLAGNLTVEVPATWATLHLVQVIKSQGLIANFELVADATNKHLLLHLKEVIATLYQAALEDSDPSVRASAVAALGEIYRNAIIFNVLNQAIKTMSERKVQMNFNAPVTGAAEC